MKRWILKFSVLGFLVPLFWIFISFVLFTARGSWTDIYWMTVHITCPVWNLQAEGDIGFLAVPFANAAVYGLVGFLLVKIKRAVIAN